MTTGLLLAGTVCCGAAPARPKDRSRNCLTKKVFLESWDAEIVRKDSRYAAAFVQKRLEEIRREGCEGLLLFPGRCSVLRWTEQIEPVASRFDLTIFVPAGLTAALFREARTVQCLPDEGFLLLDSRGSNLGLVHYDVSRCRWTGFVRSGVNVVPASEHDQLATAQWLDFTRHQFFESPLMVCDD